MSEWKAGGKAMVDLVQGPGDAHTFHIPASGGPYFLVSASALQPVADPHQALKDAVIEAAKQYMLDIMLFPKLEAAVSVLIAAQTPPKPDPVEVFYEAVDRQHLCDNVFHPSHRNCLKNVPACHCRRYIAEGLAAVEAARGAK